MMQERQTTTAEATEWVREALPHARGAGLAQEPERVALPEVAGSAQGPCSGTAGRGAGVLFRRISFPP